MTYDRIAELCEQLGYRDKLRLAQLLIQLARKEEENQNPQKQLENSQQHFDKNSAETIQYVIKRLKKLKASKMRSLLNSINSMFQFQGGISDSEKEKIVSELQRLKHIQIDKNKNVTYL